MGDFPQVSSSSRVAAGENLSSLSETIEQALGWAMQTLGKTSTTAQTENFDENEDPCNCYTKNKPKLPYEIDKIRRVTDFSRPAPTREDIVAILKNGHVKLSYVTNIEHGLRANPEYSSLVGSLLTTELIPTGVKTKRCIEEAFVVDRGFSLGETVVLYENEHAGDCQRGIERESKRGSIGQIINVKTTGDLLVLPAKTYVARGIKLDKVDSLEMVNFNSAHNYVLYKDWIGDFVNLTNDVTLIYNGHRFTVRDNGIMNFIRKDRSDDQKSCIPGEVVQVPLSDVLCAHWEKEMPFKLRRLARKKNTSLGEDTITCVIEKVEPVSVEVKWLMSPSSLEKPSHIIEKADFDKMTKIDLAANARVAADDRVRVKTTDDDEVITIADYNKLIDEEFSCKFENKTKPHDEKMLDAGQPTAIQSKEGQKTLPAKDGGPPEKNAKITIVSEGEPGPASERMEPITEQEEEHKALDEISTTDGDDQDTGRVDTQRGIVRKIHRPRMKRTRVKRIRRAQPHSVDGKPTPRKAREVLGDQFIGEVLCTHSIVDVEWMDGTISYGLPGAMLVPVDPDLDQQDHLPGVLVSRKDGDSSKEFGLILRTDQSERCAVVQWFSFSEHEAPVPKAEEQCTLFDIMPHPLYQRLVLLEGFKKA